MKIILLLLTGFLIRFGFAADRYWIAGSDANWNNSANWSTTSGGVGGASVPGAADVAIFDANGLGNCNLDLAPTLGGVTVNGYTAVIDLSGNVLSVTSGNVLLYTGTINDTPGTAELAIATTGLSRFEGTTFGAEVNCSSGRIFLDGSVFNAVASFNKTGGSNDDSDGGNVFNADLTISNTGTGHLLLGNIDPDSCLADLIINNSSTNVVYFADKSAGNLVTGNVTVNETGTATGVRMSRTATASLTIEGDLTVSSGGTVTRLDVFGDSGDLTIDGNLWVENTSSSTSQRLFFAHQAASELTVNGTTTLINNGTGANVQQFDVGINGTVNFNGNVTATNNSASPNSQMHFNRAAGNCNFNENIIIESTVAGSDGVSFGEGGGSAVLAAAKTVTVGASGYISGTTYFRNFTQTGPTAQVLTFTGTATAVFYDANWGGNVNFSAPRITTRGTVYTGTAQLEKTGISNDYSAGGNTFNGNCTLINSSPNYFAMGNGTGDTFLADLDLNNTGSSFIVLAHNSAGNTVAGNLTITNSGVGSAIRLSNGTAATLVVTGNTIFNDLCSGTTSSSYIGNDGTTTFGGTFTLNNTASVLNHNIYLAVNAASVCTFNGVVTINNSGTGATTQRIWFGYRGDLTTNANLVLNNTSAATNSEIFCNYITTSHADYNENIILSASNASNDGIRFGQGGGTANLAATKTVTLGAGGFIAGDLQFRNFTQLGTTAQALTLSGTARMYNYDSNWGGNISFIAPRMLTRGTRYNGTALLEKNGGISNDQSVGGNVFVGDFTMRNSGSEYFLMGNTTADTCEANVMMDNAGSAELYWAHNSPGNYVAGNITATLSSTATRMEMCAGGTATMQVDGDFTFTNTSSASKTFVLAGAGDVTIGGDMTLTDNSSGVLSRVYIANSSTALFTVNGNTTISNNSSVTSDSRYYIGNQGDLVFNGTLTIGNHSGATNCPMYFNLGALSHADYNDNIIVEATDAISDGIRFGESGGSATLAATKTITIGAGGFVSGDLTFRNFTQVGPTSQALTATGTARIYNYDSNWGGDVSFIAPRMLTRGTHYNGTTLLEKSGGISNDQSAGGNVFVGDFTMRNSGSEYFMMGNGTADTCQANLVIDNSGSAQVYWAHNSSGNYVAGNITATLSSLATLMEVCAGGSAELTVDGDFSLTNTSGASKVVGLGGGGDIVVNGDFTYTDNGTGGALSRFYAANSTSGSLLVNGNTVITNNSASTNDTRYFVGYSGTVTFNGTLTASNHNGALSSAMYFNHGSTSTGVYNDNIVLEVTHANSDGIRFGESGGSGTLAATRTVTIGAGGFVAGDLLFRNFTQVGPTDQSLTATGTARIYNYDSDWGGNITFIAPRMLTRGTTYNLTSHLEKTGTSDDSSPGGNLFVGNCDLVNSGTRYFLMGNGSPDVWQSNLSVVNSGSHNMYIAYASAGNTIAGTLDWEHSGDAANSYMATTTGSDLTVSGAATFTNTASGPSNVYIGGSGDVTLESSLDVTNTPTVSSTGRVNLAEGTSSMVTVDGAANFTNNGSATTSQIVVGNNGDVSFGSTVNVVNAGTGTSSYFYLGNAASSTITVADDLTYSQSGSISNTRGYFANSSTNTYNGNVTVTNGAASAGSEIYFNRTTSAISTFNGNISVTSETATTDGVRFGQDGGTATLSAGNTVSIGAGGFVAGDLMFRNFTQVGPTDQSLTATGTARIYNYDSDWGGNIVFIAPRMLTRGTTYNLTSYLEKTGATDDASPGNNLFVGNCDLVNSGTRYFLMGNGNPDVWQSNLSVVNSGAYNMYIAYSSAGNTVAGTLDWEHSGDAASSYIASNTGSDLVVSGAATFSNTASGPCNIYIGSSGDVTFESTLDVTNTPTGTGTGQVRIADATASLVTVDGAATITNNGSVASSQIIAGSSGDINFGSSLNLINAGTGTSSYFYLGNAASSAITVGGDLTFSQSGGITTTRGYLGNVSTNTYNGDVTITNSASSGNSEVYLNRATGAVSTFNGNISVTSETATTDGVRFGQDGGTATLASGNAVSIGAGGFVAGDLMFRNFTQLGPTLQTMMCTGTARIFQRDAVWNGVATFAAPRYYTRETTYNANTNITKTGASSDDSPGGNVFNGTVVITNSGTSRLRFSATNGMPDDYNGNATFVKSNTGALEPSYNNTDTYFGDINLSANAPIYFGRAGAGRVLLDGTADQSLNDLGASPIPLFRDFQVDKPSGEVNLNLPIEITVELDLDNGVVNSSTANLVYMRDNSTVSSVSDASHIDGPVEKIGNDVFVFPVGDNSVYRPISISNPSSGSARFRAEYFEVDPHPTYDHFALEFPIHHISSCEYWTLDRIASTNNVEVTLSWDTPTSCEVTFLGELIVARWDGTEWRNEGHGGTTGTLTSGTVTSAGAVTSFSPFTLGSLSANNPLPIELLTFDAKLNGSQVDVSWTTASEKDNDYFIVERSTDGVNFEFLEEVDGAGNSSTELNYKITDTRPGLGINYYRLKQVDFNGEFSYSDIRSVVLKGQGNELTAYPNPTTGLLTVELDQNDGNMLMVYDAVGRQLEMKIEVNSEQTTIDLSEYADGIYYIKTANAVVKVVKQ